MKNLIHLAKIINPPNILPDKPEKPKEIKPEEPPKIVEPKPTPLPTPKPPEKKNLTLFQNQLIQLLVK
ncbi:hypothetical protein NWE59_02430 [Mycoplasmopsis felis]|uniref:hypothetical protein n=1 Tax=Mycoplasmopsis felis TaxID=33923 RepID=UPI0021AFFE91|nr:hypothetical protein [Mycoplasmopsis felis]UWV78907.1 hypothetical protein NWE59_02430 [Mycoplasmopsis felis]UWW01004.1 hypothetical protein NW064_00910 [Mycoplasmopsis felis]